MLEESGDVTLRCLTALILNGCKLLGKPIFLQFPSRGSLELRFET